MRHWFVDRVLPGLVGAIIVVIAILVWNGVSKGNVVRFLYGVDKDELAAAANQIQQLQEALATATSNFASATNQIQQLREAVATQLREMVATTSGNFDSATKQIHELRETLATASGNLDSATNQIQQLREAVAAVTRGILSGGPGFIRLSDGTQICWGKAEVQADAGGDQRSIQATFNAFAEPPRVLVGVHQAQSGKRLAATWTPYDETITATDYRGKLLAAGGEHRAGQSVQFDYVAIGKYK
jgi:hypothetical protein